MPWFHEQADAIPRKKVEELCGRTLEEARQARLLLHVVDAANPHAEEQIKAVNQVLEELGCGDKPSLLVLNKVDKVADPSLVQVLHSHHPRAVAVRTSARCRRRW